MSSTIRGLALVLGALALVTSGCGSKDQDSTGGPVEEAHSPPKTPVKEAFGATPALPEEVAAAAFGAAEPEVVKALGWGKDTYAESKQYEGLSFSLDFDEGKGLVAVKVSSEAKLEPVLTNRWGLPQKNTDGEAFWFDATKGLRAWLPKYGSGTELRIDNYVPLQQVLGTDDKVLAFAKGRKLLGATLDELKASWGAALCNWDDKAAKLKKAYVQFHDSPSSLDMALRQATLWLCLPMRDLATRQLYDTIGFGRDGKVTSFQLMIAGGGDGKYRESIIALLDGKWGEGKETTEGKKTTRWYFDAAGGMQVEARFYEDDAHLWFYRYMPAKKLFEGAAGLSFEKDKTIGGTFAEIKASDEAHFRAHGTLASLYYPPVEYNTGLLEVSLDRWAKKETTHGYSVVLHFNRFAAFGEELFGMLEAKFGKPTRDPKSTDKDAYFDFAKDGRKVRARRVSQQWQLKVTKK